MIEVNDRLLIDEKKMIKETYTSEKKRTPAPAPAKHQHYHQQTLQVVFLQKRGKMENCIKVTMSVHPDNWKKFVRAAKETKRSLNKFFDYLIENTLDDPVERLRAENKMLQQKIQFNLSRIEVLKEENQPIRDFENKVLKRNTQQIKFKEMVDVESNS